MGAVIGLILYGLIVWGTVYIGAKKNRLALGWVLGLLFSGIGLLVMACLPEKKKELPPPAYPGYYMPPHPGHMPPPNYRPTPPEMPTAAYSPTSEDYHLPQPPAYTPPTRLERTLPDEPDWTQLQPKQ